MCLQESTNQRETKVSQPGFSKQTPGQIRLPEHALHGEGIGLLPGSGRAAWRWVSLELESFAVKVSLQSIRVLLED